MRYTYDPEADALAVEIAPEGTTIARTVELSADVKVDLNAQGGVVDLEILRASRYYPSEVLRSLESPAEYLTLGEAAREAGLAAGRLRSDIHGGRLQAVKQGRDWHVTRAALLTYLSKARGRHV